MKKERPDLTAWRRRDQLRRGSRTSRHVDRSKEPPPITIDDLHAMPIWKNPFLDDSDDDT